MAPAFLRLSPVFSLISRFSVAVNSALSDSLYLITSRTLKNPISTRKRQTGPKVSRISFFPTLGYDRLRATIFQQQHRIRKRILHELGLSHRPKGPAEWFTGTVRIDPLFQPHAPARAVGASLTFEPSAVFSSFIASRPATNMLLCDGQCSQLEDACGGDPFLVTHLFAKVDA